MKKFIAFTSAGNSSIISKEKAIEWAKTQMVQKQSLERVHIAEVIEVVERTEPIVAVKQFFVALDESALKTA